MISTNAEQYLLQSCIMIQFLLYRDFVISKKFLRDAFYHIRPESSCISKWLENNFFVQFFLMIVVV